jgi:hypothetical protein
MININSAMEKFETSTACLLKAEDPNSCDLLELMDF